MALQTNFSDEVGTGIFVSLIGFMAHCSGCVLKYLIRRFKPKNSQQQLKLNKIESNSV